MPIHKTQQYFIHSAIEHFFYDLSTDRHKLVDMAIQLKNGFHQAYTNSVNEQKPTTQETNLSLCITNPQLQIRHLEKHNANITVLEVQAYILLYGICQLQHGLQHPNSHDAFELDIWLKQFDLEINPAEPFELSEQWLTKMHSHAALAALGWDLNETIKHYTDYKQRFQLKKFETSNRVEHDWQEFGWALPEQKEKIYSAEIVPRFSGFAVTHLDLKIKTTLAPNREVKHDIPNFIPVPITTRVDEEEKEDNFMKTAKLTAIKLAEQKATDYALEELDQDGFYLALEESQPRDRRNSLAAPPGGSLHRYENEDPMSDIRVFLDENSDEDTEEDVEEKQYQDPNAIDPRSLVLYKDYYNLIKRGEMDLDEFHGLSQENIVKLQSSAIQALIRSKKCNTQIALRFSTDKIKMIETHYYLTKLLEGEIALNALEPLSDAQCRLMLLPPITNALQQNKLSFLQAAAFAQLITQENPFYSQHSLNLKTEIYCLALRLEALCQGNSSEDIQTIQHTLRVVAANETTSEMYLANQAVKMLLLFLMQEIELSFLEIPDEKVPLIFKRICQAITHPTMQDQQYLEEKSEANTENNWFPVLNDIIAMTNMTEPTERTATTFFFATLETIIINKAKTLRENINKLSVLNALSVLAPTPDPQPKLA